MDKKKKWYIMGIIGVLLLGIVVYSLGTKQKPPNPEPKVPAAEQERPAKPLPPANYYLYTPAQSVIISGNHPWYEKSQETAGKVIYNLGEPRVDLGEKWRGVKAKKNETKEIDTIEELEEKYVVYSARLTEPIKVETDTKQGVSLDRFSIVLGGKYKGTVFVREPGTDIYHPWKAKKQQLSQLVEVFREQTGSPGKQDKKN